MRQQLKLAQEARQSGTADVETAARSNEPTSDRVLPLRAGGAISTGLWNRGNDVPELAFLARRLLRLSQDPKIALAQGPAIVIASGSWYLLGFQASRKRCG